MKIVIISGCPGTGKTSVARMLSQLTDSERSVHIQLDDYWQSIKKGYIDPWNDYEGEQNAAISAAAAAGAEAFAKRGYEVYADGTLGPWFLEPWTDLAKRNVDLRYIILRPDKGTTVSRAMARQQREFFPLNPDIVSRLWDEFSSFKGYETHYADTTGQTAEQSAALIRERIMGGEFRISAYS